MPGSARRRNFAGCNQYRRPAPRPKGAKFVGKYLLRGIRFRRHSRPSPSAPGGVAVVGRLWRDAEPLSARLLVCRKGGSRQEVRTVARLICPLSSGTICRKSDSSPSFIGQQSRGLFSRCRGTGAVGGLSRGRSGRPQGVGEGIRASTKPMRHQKFEDVSKHVCTDILRSKRLLVFHFVDQYPLYSLSICLFLRSLPTEPRASLGASPLGGAELPPQGGGGGGVHPGGQYVIFKSPAGRLIMHQVPGPAPWESPERPVLRVRAYTCTLGPAGYTAPPVDCNVKY